VIVPLASWLDQEHGWRSAAATLGVLLGATTIPIHALLLRSDPAAVGQRPDGAPDSPDDATDTEASPAAGLRAVIAERRFWGLTTAFALSSLVSVATTVHLIPYLTERHVSPVLAGSILGLVGLMQLPGRIVFGPLRQALDWRWATATVLLVQAAALVVLAVAPGTAPLMLFACLFGMGNGMATLLRASTIAELYGRARYGRVSGVVALLGTCGRAAGPLLAALALAAWSSYALAFGGLAFVLGLAAVLVIVPWRSSAVRDAEAIAPPVAMRGWP
jgi:predicted MFS family arabinose efflux permease